MMDFGLMLHYLNAGVEIGVALSVDSIFIL